MKVSMNTDFERASGAHVVHTVRNGKKINNNFEKTNAQINLEKISAKKTITLSSRFSTPAKHQKI